MTTSPATLCGAGLPPNLATLLGLGVMAATGNGTAQSGATLLKLGANFFTLTTSGGNTAFQLPDAGVIGYELHA
jgi:hypothetical protein